MRPRRRRSPRARWATCALGLALMACAPSGDHAAPPAPAPPRLTLADAAPASVADLCAEAPRAWDVLGADGVVARVRGRCLGKETRGTHFVTQVIPADGEAPARETHLWLSRSGRPRLVQIRQPLRVTRVRWVAEGLLVSLYGDNHVTAADDGATPWVLTRHDLPTRELMLRLTPPREDGTITQRAYVPERDEIVSVRLAISGAGEALRARSEHGTVELRAPGGRWSAAHIESVTDAAGNLVYRERRAQEFEPVFPEVPRPSYTLPADLQARAVIIPGDGDAPTLAGELVLAASGGDERRCGVVFLSGSGPQDRYGFVPGTSIDIGSHELHDALARAGCVVLRFDDRGVGASARGPENPGYLDLVDDARRAVAFLMRRPEVDPRRVVIVGHSEGAMTAARLGHERFRVDRRPVRPAALVLMAMPGRNLRRVIESQVRDSLAGRPKSEIEDAIAKNREIHDKIAAGEPVPANVAPVAKYLREMFEFDPMHEIETLSIPVYLAQGSKDFQVSPQEDFFPLARLLRKPGPPEGTARVFDGLDHLFKPEPGRSKVGHYNDLTRHVDPEFIAAVVTWVREQAGEPRR